MSPQKLKLITLIFGIGAVILDQIIKFVLLWKIPTSGIFIISSTVFSFQLKLAYNSAVAFSIPVPRILIFIITLILLLGLFYFLIQSTKKNLLLITISLGLIMGAAISNLLDRVLHGAVIDYLNLTIYNYHWATFNLADSLITSCALIIIIANLRKKI